MNKIYKVVWSKARNCYVVASEFAKSHQSDSRRIKSASVAAVMAAVVLTGFSGLTVQAAVTVDKDGIVKADAADISALNDLLKNGVTKSKDGSVSVGELTVKQNGERAAKKYLLDGAGARLESALGINSAPASITFGNCAVSRVWNDRQEHFFSYDGEPQDAPGPIAIGSYTYARPGSIMIGSHVYKGNMGDVKNIDTDNWHFDTDGAYGDMVNMTTIGTNSFTKGFLTTTIGDYNIQSGRMGYAMDYFSYYGLQNFGATVVGTLNSNESYSVPKSKISYSGFANSIIGIANTANNANGALIYGAGNEIRNSVTDISDVVFDNTFYDAANAQETLKNVVAKSEAGGAVLAIGGANTADWAQKSQLIGVGNTLTGTSDAVSKYDMINGYKNEVTNATNTSIIGSNNKAKDVQATTIMGDNNDLTGNGNHIIGDNHKVTGKNNILIGNNDALKTHSGNDSVVIGNNASAGNGSMVMGNKAHAGNTGIALGMNASAGDGQNLAVGYYANVSGVRNSTALGYASQVTKRDILDVDGNDGVVSVGKSVGQSGEAGITRRIINVKAGVNDTDAVNVSQLKGVETVAKKGWNLSTNNNAIDATNVAPGDYVDFSGDDNVLVSNENTKVKVALNKNINVNSVQTIGLNAKYNLSVGTAAANGKMPFLVNSKGAVYAAGGDFSVEKDGSVKATSGDIGNVKLNNGVLYKNSALRDGELYVGDTDGNYSQITSKNAKLGKVTIDENGRISGVAAGRIAADSTDAVNGSQLHAVQQEAGKHTKVVNGSNITVEETDQDGQKTYKVGLNKDILLGDISGKYVSISGSNGTIDTTGYIATKDRVYADKGAKLADIDVTGDTISNDKASVKLDKEGTVTINNTVTVDQNGKISGVAAGRIAADSTDAVNGSQLKETNDRVSKVEGDITNIKGDITNIKSDITNIKGDVKNLGDRVTQVEQTAGKHSSVSEGDSNIKVDGSGTNEAGGTDYKVSLNKDLKLDSVTTGDTKMDTNGITVGDNVSLTKEGLTAGDTKVTNDGLSIGDKTYVSKDGLNANNQTITNVADGKVEKGSTDAVNGGQLYETNQAIANNATNISTLSHSISNLDNRVNKVGAGAAALAALHPLDFDPDAKWDFAAGYGNYRGTNAAAIGAYYRPNEDTMFSIGGTFGNGENMVNAGVSFKLGAGSSHVSTSRVAMAKEIKELRSELEAMKSAMLDANAGKKIDTSKLQLFPDVPQNHWAYEYVAQLAGNGMIEGYPDGNFAGDRPMTRYEFAAVLYRAMMKGAVLSDKILSEFSHELEYFTVDTVAKDKAGNPTIQRVRTVKANTNK